MIYGNQHTLTQLTTLIHTLISNPDQSVYPFILLVGPAHIGKTSMISEIMASTQINSYDIAVLKDLSDDWMSLKESNDLTGTSHSIQIEVESKRQDIKLDDGTIVHNRGVRELQDRLVRSPIGSDKVVIIEAIERATGGASNALLKTLEEPLPHRLILATSNSIDQLPATIVSRAMIFRMDRLSDMQMDEGMDEFMPNSASATRDSILTLAAGRPGVIIHYQQLGILDDVIASWNSIQSQIKTGTIAQLYQQMVIINKSDYLSVILDALLVVSEKSGDRALYDATFDLIRKMDSNVTVDNLLFEWCVTIKSRKVEK